MVLNTGVPIEYWISGLKIRIKDKYLEPYLLNYRQENATLPHRRLINIVFQMAHAAATVYIS